RRKVASTELNIPRSAQRGATGQDEWDRHPRRHQILFLQAAPAAEALTNYVRLDACRRGAGQANRHSLAFTGGQAWDEDRNTTGRGWPPRPLIVGPGESGGLDVGADGFLLGAQVVAVVGQVAAELVGLRRLDGMKGHEDGLQGRRRFQGQ